MLCGQQGVPASGNTAAPIQIDALANRLLGIKGTIVGGINRIERRHGSIRNARYDSIDLPVIGELVPTVAGESISVELAENITRSTSAGDEFIGVDITAPAQIDRRTRVGDDILAAQCQYRGGRRIQRIGVIGGKEIFLLIGGRTI